MCGISALFSLDGQGVENFVYPMTQVVRHRGPDSEGYALVDSRNTVQFCGGPDTPASVYGASLPYAPESQIAGAETTATVALGHRRLVIIDVTAGGHQPMSFERNRYLVVYNGEIYNYLELRRELETAGHRFVSQSDTEVLLHAYREWGVACLSRFNGMFSFVLFDRESHRILAARDRFGIKPLYYWFSPQGFLAFGSEIKQFATLPGWRARLNGQRAFDYLAFGHTDHTAETMFDGVFQIRGGESVEIGMAQLATCGGRLPVSQWYRLKPGEWKGSFEDATAQWGELFEDSVRIRLRADVPVGTGLSGGPDSSSITCMTARIRRDQKSRAKNHTFTACSTIDRFDERMFAEEVVRHSGAQGHYVYPSLERLLEEMGDVIKHHDEPFASTSVYAEWNVFRLVAETPVKVTLDGHGADEVLAGYLGFFRQRLGGLIRRFRWFELLREIQHARRRFGYGIVDFAEWSADSVLPGPVRQSIRKATGRASVGATWMNASLLGARRVDPNRILTGSDTDINIQSLVQLAYTSVPRQLNWNDRDSMAHSIESRVPFLDHRLVEHALALPEEYKFRRGETKRVLREAMRGILPENVRNRVDKMGFVTPEEVWMCDDRPEEFRRLVREAVDRSSGVLNREAIQKADRILDRRDRFSSFVWRIICFGRWMEEFSLEGPQL